MPSFLHEHFALLAIPLFFIAAVLYTSVGHGGASGYLAAMALLGFSPSLLRSTSLSLNIVAASVALLLFMRRSTGTIAWSQLFTLLLPFVSLGIPMAFIGGQLSLTGTNYTFVLGLLLMWAAWSLIQPRTQDPSPSTVQARWWMWPAGACIGLLSGLTGVGGGIFLSPLLVLTGIVGAKHSAPVSAALILLNSIAGLLGLASTHTAYFAPELPAWITAVACGAVIGAYWGSVKVSAQWLRRMLASVLLVAAAKLLGIFSFIAQIMH